MNFIGLLKNSKRATLTKQAPSQEKSIIKVIEVLCGVFTCPCFTPSPMHQSWSRASDSWAPSSLPETRRHTVDFLF